jgi:Ca2+-binding EF-hand superfamily protein
MKPLSLLAILLICSLPLSARETHSSIDIVLPAKDQNHDGKISKKEAFAGFHDYLEGTADLNGKGSVSKSELQKTSEQQPKQKTAPTVTINFKDLDTNGDGKIDATEIKQLSKNMSIVADTRDVTGNGGDSRSKVMDSANDIGVRIRF